MSEQFWTLLINAVVTVVTVISGVVVLWIKQVSSAAEVKQAAQQEAAKVRNQAAAQAAAQTVALADNTAKTEEVHRVVNSQRDAMLKEIASLKETIALMAKAGGPKA